MSTTTRINHETFTIHFERLLNAPREDVFNAWTRAEEVSEWWDPTGAKLVSCSIDLRPGGSFSFVNVGHGPPFAGVYRVVERPALLEFDVLGSAGSVRLEARGEDTFMRVAIRCASKEHLDQFIKLGVAQGTERTLENLAAFV